MISWTFDFSVPTDLFVTPVTLINRKYSICLWWAPYVDTVNTAPRRLHRNLVSSLPSSAQMLKKLPQTASHVIQVAQTCLRHLSFQKNWGFLKTHFQKWVFSHFTVCLIHHNSKAGIFLNTLRKFTFMHTKTISKFRTRNLSHYVLTSHTGTPGNYAQFQSIKFKIKWESCSTYYFPVIT